MALKETLTLRACHCDAQGRWKPSAILLTMQEVGEDHAAALGFSRDFLVEHGMCWVLSRQKVQMREYPRYGDEIKVVTWPGALEELFFTRYFRFERPDGSLLGGAATAWVLFDIHTRRLLRPGALPGQVPVDDREQPLFPLPGKLHMDGLTQIAQRTVSYSDLDVNEHMNNASYADWICDVADFDRLCRHGLASFQINYINEGLQGERIRLMAAQGDEGMMIQGLRDDEKTMFEAQIAY